MAKPKLGVVQKSSREFIKAAYKPFGFATPVLLRSTRFRNRDDWERIVPECAPAKNYDEFFPTKKEKEMENKAKRVCAACPLFFVCGEKQLLKPDKSGIRAGMAARQIRELRSTIGKEMLDTIATLRPDSDVRRAFFDVTKVVLGAAVLHEIPIEEARQMIDQIPMPQEIAIVS